MAVHAEAVARGYAFDRAKFKKTECRAITVTQGQMEYEWDWLMSKHSVFLNLARSKA